MMPAAGLTMARFRVFTMTGLCKSLFGDDVLGAGSPEEPP